jgi:hypothetical protein
MVIVGVYADVMGSGKTSFARAVVNALDERHAVAWINFADPIKDISQSVAKRLGHDRPQAFRAKLSPVRVGDVVVDPRQFQQKFGTDLMRRHFGEDIWAEVWRADVLASGADVVIVDDVRFHNEARVIRALNGSLVKISRPGVRAPRLHWRIRAAITSWLPVMHSSEGRLSGVTPDFFVNNTGSLADLSHHAEAIIKELDLHAR